MSKKKLIFLGTNSVMERHIEACERQGQEIFGIIDSDWYGNTDSIAGVPVIDTQVTFESSTNKYKDFVFFIGTNFRPNGGRDIDKRQSFIDLVRKHQLECVNLIDPSSHISRFAKLGQGIFIGANVVVEPNAVIEDFVTLWGINDIGHNATIGEGSVVQRGACVNSCLGKNVYVGLGAWVFIDRDTPLTIGDNAVIDSCLHVSRDVAVGERVQMDRNFIRIYRARGPSTV